MRRLEPWLLAAALWGVDFVSKRVILAHREALQADRVEVLGEFFRIAFVLNPGAAMGLTAFGRWTLVAISVGAAAALVWFLIVTPTALRVRRLAMAMILGGALGNLVDRIFYDGYVVDFLDVDFFQFRIFDRMVGMDRFWTFNVADIGVTCGGALLLLSLLVEEYRARRSDQAAATPDHD